MLDAATRNPEARVEVAHRLREAVHAHLCRKPLVAASRPPIPAVPLVNLDAGGPLSAPMLGRGRFEVPRGERPHTDGVGGQDVALVISGGNLDVCILSSVLEEDFEA